MFKRTILFFGLLLLISCKEKVADGLILDFHPPKKWFKMPSEEELFKQLYKDSAYSKLEKSKKINKNFKVYASYLKYDNTTHSGLNPTIQIQIHDNSDKTFEGFYASMLDNVDWYHENVPGFKILEGPEKIRLDNISAFHFIMTHLQTIDGSQFEVRTKYFAIPTGNTFYQITLNDDLEHDCTAEFNHCIKSFKFSKL